MRIFPVAFMDGANTWRMGWFFRSASLLLLLLCHFFVDGLGFLKFSEGLLPFNNGGICFGLFSEACGIFEVIVAGVQVADDFEAKDKKPCFQVGRDLHVFQIVDPLLPVIAFALHEEFFRFGIFEFLGLLSELFFVALINLDAEVEEFVELGDEFLVGKAEGGREGEDEKGDTFHVGGYPSFFCGVSKVRIGNEDTLFACDWLTLSDVWIGIECWS